jgi:tellurite resistance protein
VSDADLPESEINYLDALQKALALGDDEARALFEDARQHSGLKTVEEKAAQMREMMPRFVDCMALMASADGEVHDDELEGVRQVLRSIPDMQVLTRDELDEAIDVSFGRIKDKDVGEELKTIAQVIPNPADRYWTTVYMMIIARSDGRTDWREVRFLQQAKKEFALSDSHMDQAMETASMFPGVELGGPAPA